MGEIRVGGFMEDMLGSFLVGSMVPTLDAFLL